MSGVLCVCCGRRCHPTDARVERGHIHFSCWNEHHSDPTTEWPVGHICDDGIVR